jgi:hypothetical protein
LTAPPPKEAVAGAIQPAIRREKLDCQISKQHVKDGKLHVNAQCSSTKKLRVGLYGTLTDSKSGAQIKNGGVRIRSIQKNTIELLATTATEKTKADTVRFWVR